MSGYAIATGLSAGDVKGAPVDRPITRLEVARDRLQGIAKAQVGINDRLTGLANALCGGHPASATGERDAPRALPSGLAEELDELAVCLVDQQRHTQELITRLAEAIPEIR